MDWYEVTIQADGGKFQKRFQATTASYAVIQAMREYIVFDDRAKIKVIKTR